MWFICPAGSGISLVVQQTKATIETGKIDKSGSTWASVSDAKRKYDCPDTVAATLWVMDEIGALNWR